MDYSKFSDQEINKLVAFALGCKEVVPDIFMDDVRRYEFDKPKNKSGNKFYFDPCNNPSDAWPIIVENKISIVWMTEEKQWCAWANGELEEGCWAWKYCPDDYMNDDNPLRAAMCLFLMMKESANVQDNPA